MKVLALLSVILLSYSSFASNDSLVSNHECIGVYRDGFIDLKDFVDSFNEEDIDRFEFSALVAGNSTQIAARRGACLVFENPAVDECVFDYKELYKKLRSNIRLRSVIVGNQSRISYTEQIQEIREVDQIDKEPSGFFKGLGNLIRTGSATTREEIEKVRQVAKLELLDRKCGY